MTVQDPLDKTDYSLHTDEELRRAIQQVDDQEARVATEDSGDALDAARRQRTAMQAELDRRKQRWTPQQMLRTTAAGMLSGLAKVMSVGAELTGQVATTLRERDGRGAGTDAPRQTEPVTVDEVLDQVGEQPQTEAAEAADVREPTNIPAPDGPSHVRTHETHLEELAARSAADVVAAIPELSTDELRRLYEHESANKKRKTVLQAIERAAEPSTTSPG